MINLSQTKSEQYFETSDDFESYGLTLFGYNGWQPKFESIFDVK